MVMERANNLRQTLDSCTEDIENIEEGCSEEEVDEIEKREVEDVEEDNRKKLA